MVKAAVIQLNSGNDVTLNLQVAEKVLKKASEDGAKLAVLPENFAWMGREQDAATVFEAAGGGPIQDFLNRISQTTGLCIIAGSMWLKSEIAGKAYNACLVYQADGKCVARYDKLHLFDAIVATGEAYRESDAFEAGDEWVVCETPLGPTGLTICYDVRFPALYAALTQAGAKIITVPAAFTQTSGKAHWHTLLRARAIENQVYILAAAQTGQHATGRQTYGHALIIDPWGTVLADAGTDPGYLMATIDLALVDEIRQNMPVAQHATKTVSTFL